jgi:hypothetical protein
MGLVTMVFTLNVFILFVFLIYSIHTLLKKRATILTDMLPPKVDT